MAISCAISSFYISQIPPFKHAAFLHTKRVAAIAGSRAAVMFTQQKSQSVVAFGWNNPYMGANYIGVKVEQSANAPIVRSNLYEVMYNHKGTVGEKEGVLFYFGIKCVKVLFGVKKS